MGWKAVKEYYRIGHSVHVTDEGLCIGSPFVHNLIVIDDEGGVHPNSIVGRHHDDLGRYIRDLESNPDKLRELMRQPDTFEKSVTVYTYDGGEIVEKQCEEPGWPNCTHDGEIMYENTFSTDKAEVVKWAKSNAAAGVRICQESVANRREQLREAEEHVAGYKSDVEKLNKDYPND